MSSSPCSNRVNACGHNGSSHSSSARFEQLPFRIQMRGTGRLLNNQRSAKSSSFVMMTALSIRGCSQTDFEDVRSVMTLRVDPPRERRRQLRVN